MEYPREVLNFPDSPLAGALTSSGSIGFRNHAEVTMAGSLLGPQLENT
jgi:hypothetical protein